MRVLRGFTYSPTMVFILLRFVVTVVVLASSTDSLPTSRGSNDQAVSNLPQFGNLRPLFRDSQSEQIQTNDALTEVLQEFQAFAGLNATGSLNQTTMTLMNTPRCGVKDTIGFGTSSRTKRFALKFKLEKNAITYKIIKYPSTLNKFVTDMVMKRAFDLWADVAPLTFTQIPANEWADIVIRFDRIDGPNGALARTQPPVQGRTWAFVTFDDSEEWSVNSDRGAYLTNVAAHEFGHAIGLDDSLVPQAIMYTRVYHPVTDATLHDDDIAAVQALYGWKVSDKRRSEPITDATPVCGVPKIVDNVTPLIANGQPAPVGAFPWHAGLYQRRNESWELICGGTLITNRVILTAAHCVTVGNEVSDLQNFQVALGKYYRSWHHQEPTEEKRSISEIVIQPLFDHTRKFQLDIALLLLNQEIRIGEYIMPACRDYDERTARLQNPSRNLHVVGWGQTSPSSRPSETLLHNTVTAISQFECRQFASVLSFDKFCAKNSSPESITQRGDSGGGATSVYEDGRHYIVGIVSMKTNFQGDKPEMGFFTNVTWNIHSNWIENQLKQWK